MSTTTSSGKDGDMKLPAYASGIRCLETPTVTGVDTIQLTVPFVAAGIQMRFAVSISYCVVDRFTIPYRLVSIWADYLVVSVTWLKYPPLHSQVMH